MPGKKPGFIFVKMLYILYVAATHMAIFLWYTQINKTDVKPSYITHATIKSEQLVHIKDRYRLIILHPSFYWMLRFNNRH